MLRAVLAPAFAAVLCASSVSGPPLLSASFEGTSAMIGGTVGVNAVFSVTPPLGSQAYIVFGTAAGRTTTTVGGQSVTLPLTGAVWVAATASVSGTTASVKGAIPQDATLVGETLRAVVVLITPSGDVLVSASVGGPIIEDAIA